MKTIKKPIEVIEIIENLYKLESSLDGLPPISGDRIIFNVTIDSIGDLIAIADQFNSSFFEPSASLPYHWVIIDIGDKIRLSLETPRELYKIIY